MTFEKIHKCFHIENLRARIHKSVHSAFAHTLSLRGHLNWNPTHTKCVCGSLYVPGCWVCVSVCVCVCDRIKIQRTEKGARGIVLSIFWWKSRCRFILCRQKNQQLQQPKNISLYFFSFLFIINVKHVFVILIDRKLAKAQFPTTAQAIKISFDS